MKHTFADEKLIIPHGIRDNLGKADSQAGFHDLFCLYQMDALRLI
jgi:hypothetical protein